MMLVTKEDVAVHVMQCIKMAATKRNLKDVDWRSSEELLEELEQVDSVTYCVLMEYLNAYRSWHEYHVWIEKNGKSMQLNDHEKATLKQRIAERDEKRKSIVLRLETIAR